MERQILDLSEGQRHLSKQRGLLVIQCDTGTEDQKTVKVSFDDIEAIIVHTPQASYSNGCIVELAVRNIPLVISDTNHMPVGWFSPAEGNYEQSRRIGAQVDMTKPLRGRLWTRVVRAKLEGQAAVLEEFGQRSGALMDLAKSVRPGDPNNTEATGARRYWRLLMGPEFQRNKNGAAPNGLFNYGYTVLRAAVARQICAAGLHPSIGLHHSNRFNAFCLVDDLMEPLRPLVDRCVVHLNQGGVWDVTPEAKSNLTSVLAEERETKRGAAPLSRCIEWAAQSLVQSMLNKRDELQLPNPKLIFR